MRPENFDVHKLIDAIQGTCEGIDSTACRIWEVEEFDFTIDMTSGELITLDKAIFECKECGWWVELSEAGEDDGDESRCLDCARSTEYD